MSLAKCDTVLCAIFILFVDFQRYYLYYGISKLLFTWHQRWVDRGSTWTQHKLGAKWTTVTRLSEVSFHLRLVDHHRLNKLHITMHVQTVTALLYRPIPQCFKKNSASRTNRNLYSFTSFYSTFVSITSTLSRVPKIKCLFCLSLYYAPTKKPIYLEWPPALLQVF